MQHNIYLSLIETTVCDRYRVANVITITKHFSVFFGNDGVCGWEVWGFGRGE
jgi:hypothetical protein